MLELCRKKLMGRNLQKMQRVFPQHYDFFPKTFILPVDMQVRGSGAQHVRQGRAVEMGGGGHGEAAWQWRCCAGVGKGRAYSCT